MEKYCLRRLKRLHAPGGPSSGCMVEKLYRSHVDRYDPPEVAAKFLRDPAAFFPGMAIVLKSPSENERGVILLKYSYAFPLFMRLFHAGQIARKYFIVLEPSWNGYFNFDILCYHLLKAPVFVQALEPRDQKLLNTFNTELRPVPLGTNWWVDDTVFKPIEITKDIDVVMVASWADFKRHYKFFKVVKQLKSEGLKLRISLVGYPIERTLDSIREQADYFGISDQVELFEWLSPEQVNHQMNRAKINLVWSRYEGNNRVIVEGLFAGLPVILREGFNYGHPYDFINERTGTYANEENLGQTIRSFLENPERFAAREWALEHMTCHRATGVLNRVIGQRARQLNERFSNGLAVKVNELHGLRYLDPDSADRFKTDYTFLESMKR